MYTDKQDKILKFFAVTNTDTMVLTCQVTHHNVKRPNVLYVKATGKEKQTITYILVCL